MDFLKQIPILEFLCCELSTLFTQPSRLALEDSGQKLDVAPPARPMTYPVSVPNATALASPGWKMVSLEDLIFCWEPKWIYGFLGNFWVPPEFYANFVVICWILIPVQSFSTAPLIPIVFCPKYSMWLFDFILECLIFPLYHALLATYSHDIFINMNMKLTYSRGDRFPSISPLLVVSPLHSQ